MAGYELMPSLAKYLFFFFFYTIHPPLTLPLRINPCNNHSYCCYCPLQPTIARRFVSSACHCCSYTLLHCDRAPTLSSHFASVQLNTTHSNLYHACLRRTTTPATNCVRQGPKQDSHYWGRAAIIYGQKTKNYSPQRNSTVIPVMDGCVDSGWTSSCSVQVPHYTLL